LADFKKPKSVTFAPALPKNIIGKVLKTALREMYEKANGEAHGF
jgi:acyl-coenzyme A synthetase/AMP-(fatty) acid ligase